jgi:hypothetical protein
MVFATAVGAKAGSRLMMMMMWRCLWPKDSGTRTGTNSAKQDGEDSEEDDEKWREGE